MPDDTQKLPKQPPKLVPGWGRFLIGAYLVAFLGFALYAIVALWPNQYEGVKTTFLCWAIPENCEPVWILLALASGALGGLIHSLRSFYWYVGNRELVRSWVGMYLFLPLVGGALSVIFYVVIRGGLFSGNLPGDGLNPIGFAAVGAIVGLFSEQAILKLKEVANTLFTTPGTGEDKTTNPDVPQDE